MKRHKSGETPSNKHGFPWILIGWLHAETRQQAMQLEKQITE
ncbi:MAG: hypothetical protein SFU87_16665 [Chitinophagaceae bacterium]|nr:hypothetical protein [Chitinophagaceae bacterium]